MLIIACLSMNQKSHETTLHLFQACPPVGRRPLGISPIKHQFSLKPHSPILPSPNIANCLNHTCLPQTWIKRITQILRKKNQDFQLHRSEISIAYGFNHVIVEKHKSFYRPKVDLPHSRLKILLESINGNPKSKTTQQPTAFLIIYQNRNCLNHDLLIQKII